MLGVLWMVVSGCHTDGCDFSGLKEMAGKEPTGVDFPGEELGPVTGFHPLHVLGRNGKLKAIAGYDDGGSVLVVPADRTEPCTVFAIPADASASRHVPGVLEDMLAVLDSVDTSGLGTLSLYDPRCQKIGTEFANARLVSRSERLVPLRMLIVENTDELVAVDADDRERRLIDRDVGMVQVLAERVVVQAGGQLVIRDMALKESARHGSDVTEATVGRDSKGIAYIDGGRLHFLDNPDGEARALDDDACGLGFADEASRDEDNTPRFLSYYSPCEEGHLVVYDLQRDVRSEVGLASSSRAEARELDAGGEGVTAVFYEEQLAEDAGTPTVLSVALEGEEPVVLGPSSLNDVGRASEAGVTVWLDSGGEDSRIARVSAADGVRVDDLLGDVVGFEVNAFPERALVRGDGAGTSLVVIEGNSQPTVVAEGSPTVGRGSGTRMVYGSDADGDVGTLNLLEEGERTVEIADRVAISTAGFAFSGESLLYIENFDATQLIGDLCMRIIRNGDTYCQTDVAEYRAAIRPKRAVVYVKAVGRGARLFWAPVQ